MMRTMEVAAFLTRRPLASIRHWYRTGAITTVACDLRTRAILVDVAEVRELAERKQRRRPRAA